MTNAAKKMRVKYNPLGDPDFDSFVCRVYPEVRFLKIVVCTNNDVLLSNLIKREMLPFSTTWMDLKVTDKLNKQETQRQILQNLTYMWNQKKLSS